MRIILIGLVLLLAACGPAPEPAPEAPPATPTVDELIDVLNRSESSQRWLLNEYEIWQYLKAHPSESDVLSTLGPPDSVYNDFDQTYKILYYFIPKLNDYNSIEIDAGTGRVSGFEWD